MSSVFISEDEMKKLRNFRASASIMVLLSMLAMPIGTLAQTRVIAPKNPYEVSKDVELGRQAAQEVERQLPRLEDNEVQSYVDRIGSRLAESIPAEYRHPEFRYTYTVVDVRDVNAFALPGGFTYVNRGLIETAQNEAQLAGVIAHEISHAALRHGTAQAAKAQKYQVGSILGQIAGAVIGGGVGQVVGGLSQLGISAAFLRYSREYERQADTLGAQIMASAGYDPRELANMFRILEQLGGNGGPEFLSSHPNPGNRFEAINREAAMLRVQNPVRNTSQFSMAQARLRDLPRARSMEEIARNAPRSTQDSRYPDQGRYPDEGRIGRVEYPSSRYRTVSAGNALRLQVPDNWRQLGGNNELTFVPEGAYGQVQGQFVFTHGVQVGVTRADGANLRQATDQYISELTQGNRNLRTTGGYRREYVGNREGLSVVLNNFNEVTRRNEVITVYTARLRGGDLFYMVAVAPREEYNSYQRVFQNIVRTVELND
jgi:Zn-dependent protease with chaperone function